MTEFALDPKHVITDEQSLRALFKPTHALAALKCRPSIRPACAGFHPAFAPHLHGYPER